MLNYECNLLVLTDTSPAKYHIEQLEADWAVGHHLVGQGNLQSHWTVVPLVGGHHLRHVIREAVGDEEDHPVKGPDTANETFMVLEKPTPETPALDGRRVGYIVLVQSTVGPAA